MFSGVSLDQAPPIRIPLRFMLSAPFFGMLAGLFIAFGYEGEVSRYGSSTIIAAHLLFAGFAGFVMLGALFQMLPVVVGVRFLYQEFIAKAALVLIGAGLVLFMLRYMTYEPYFGFGALVLMLGGFVLFALGALASVAKRSFGSPTSLAITLALAFLLSGVLLGGHLLFSSISGNMGERFYSFVDAHIFLLFFGWILMLIVGISFQVVPMFWVTKEYSPFCKKFIVPFLGVVVLLYPLFLLLFESVWMQKALLLATLLPLLAYVATTLLRLGGRKRKRFDIVVLSWQLAMGWALLGALVYIVDIASEQLFPIYLGVLFGLGFAITLIIGMLYKIVPFLVWFHLSSKGVFDIPMMGAMLHEGIQKLQLTAHNLAIVALMLGLFLELGVLLSVGGVLLSASFMMLFYNLRKAYGIYLAN